MGWILCLVSAFWLTTQLGEVGQGFKEPDSTPKLEAQLVPGTIKSSSELEIPKK